MRIKGSIAPNLTFFDKEGNLDLEKTRWHMNWILDCGVNGLFVTGTYGSGYLMSPEQRVRIYKLAKEVSSSHNNSFVIAHVGANDTTTSVLLTKYACECGLDAVSAVNPYTFSYTDDELVEYYRSVVSASGKLPVFAYNNPGLTGKAIDYKLLKKFESIGISAVKDSSINIQLATSIYNDNLLNGKEFKYISGTTTGWLTFRKLGVDTMIAGACNYTPELVSALYKISMLDDEKKSIKAYNIVSDMTTKIKIGNSLLSSHIALKARGFDAGFMKAPLIADYNKYSDKLPMIADTIEKAICEMKLLNETNR